MRIEDGTPQRRWWHYVSRTVLLVACAACGTCGAPACAGRRPSWGFWQKFRRHGGVVVGVDPTVTWTPVTTDCTGAALSAPVLGYNVYAVPGSAFPTVTSANTELPCGPQTLVDHTKATPLNGSTPIASSACTGTPPVCTYATTLGTGTYTVAVEAIAADGTPSPVSNTVTVAVVLRPGAAGVKVGK